MNKKGWTLRNRRGRHCAAFVGAALILTGLTGMHGIAAARAAFPGTNGRIAFESEGDILVINADGTGQTNLTHNTGSVVAAHPAWSPDGKRLLFVRASPPGDVDLYVANADGSGARNLTNSPAEDEANPAWSPDGKKIAFSRLAGAGSGIFVMNADGSGQTRVADQGTGLAWSPDGKKIAFASSRGGFCGSCSQIWVMNPDGTGQTNLTNAPDWANREPSWSPDGKRISFSSIRPGAGLMVMNADGTNPRSLTQFGSDRAPAWSPDGRRIAFVANRNSPSPCCQLFVMNADGTAQTRVRTEFENQVAVGAQPDWQPLAQLRCRVPNVVGERLRTARTSIRRANCSVGRIRYERSHRARGRVIRQSPRPRTRLAQGSRVALVVSKGSKATTRRSAR